MDVEEVKVLCDQLKQKTINMEKELVCYMMAKKLLGTTGNSIEINKCI